MKLRTLFQTAVALAICVPALSALRGSAPAGAAQIVQPKELSPLAKIVASTSAIVEGTLGPVSYSYSEEAGPRTEFVLTDVKLHAGSVPQGELKISIFGGFRDDGRFITTSESPRLLEKTRYLMLLTNGMAFWSPFAFNSSAFAIREVQGKSVLVNDGGAFLTAVSLVGFRFSDDLATGPVEIAEGKAVLPEAKNGVDVSAGLTVEAAVTAITDAASSEGVSLSGVLPSAAPPWYPWNEIPVAPAAE
jgi:hypothetical protein